MRLKKTLLQFLLEELISKVKFVIYRLYTQTHDQVFFHTIQVCTYALVFILKVSWKLEVNSLKKL